MIAAQRRRMQHKHPLIALFVIANAACSAPLAQGGPQAVPRVYSEAPVERAVLAPAPVLSPRDRLEKELEQPLQRARGLAVLVRDGSAPESTRDELQGVKDAILSVETKHDAHEVAVVLAEIDATISHLDWARDVGARLSTPIQEANRNIAQAQGAKEGTAAHLLQMAQLGFSLCRRISVRARTEPGYDESVNLATPFGLVTLDAVERTCQQEIERVRQSLGDDQFQASGVLEIPLPLPQTDSESKPSRRG